MNSKATDFMHTLIGAVCLIILAGAKFKGIDLGSVGDLLQLVTAGVGGSYLRGSPVSGGAQ